MRRSLYLILVSLLSLVVFNSCDNRREMFTERMIYGKVSINIDWQNAKSSPNGGTVVFFPDTTVRTPFMTKQKVLVMMNGSYEEIYVPYMKYDVISFNETYDDFDFIKFRSIDSPEEFEAYTQSISVSSKYSKAQNYYITSSPDALYIDNYGLLEVSKSADYENEIDINLNPERVSPLISIKVHITNIDNLARSGSAASISGLSEGINMSTKTPTDVEVAHMMKIDNRSFLPGSYQNGYTAGQIYIFGVSRLAEKNILTIYLKLRDGSDYPPIEYDITEKLQLLRDFAGTTNISLNLDIGLGEDPTDPKIELPYVEDSEEPGTGFDPDVEEWGEEEEHEIELSNNIINKQQITTKSNNY